MRSLHLLPDVITIKTVAIDACKKCEQQALCLLAESRSVNRLPDDTTYSIAISFSENCQEWQQALGLFAEMRSVDFVLDVTTYYAAVAACKASL